MGNQIAINQNPYLNNQNPYLNNQRVNIQFPPIYSIVIPQNPQNSVNLNNNNIQNLNSNIYQKKMFIFHNQIFNIFLNFQF
jgi:hypothetical protein